MATIATLLVKLTADAAQFQREMEKTQTLAGKVASNMSEIGKTMTLGVTAPLVGAGTAAAKFAIDYESAFAGVRKVIDATDEELAELSQGIRDMAKELPASAVNIADVAAAAGQLGIETGSILGFTRVMIDLGESSNLSATEAATALARLANITQMPQDQFDRLGSTVVALGNSLATTEAEIVEMGLRLAGAGKQVGMTEAEILSLAGALSSVGIEAQMGGSAFSRVMVQMQLAVEKGGEALDDFARVAGMSAGGFKTAFQQDAAGAIIAFITGLGTAEQRGLSAIKVLDDMGISEVRLRDALLRASGAGDLFSQSIKTGTQAWEENVALANEAAQRYETTASQLQILKNNIVETAIQFGELMLPYIKQVTEKIKELTERFQQLEPEQRENIIRWAMIVAAIGPVLVIGANLVTVIEGIIAAKTFLATTAIPALTTKAIPALGKALLWLAANPVVLIIAAIAALIAAGVWLYKNWDVVKEKIQAVWELIAAAAEAYSIRAQQAWFDLQRRIGEVVKAILDAIAPLIEWLPDSISGGFKRMREAVENQLELINGRLDNLSGRAEENSKRVQNALNGITQAAKRTREALEYTPELHGWDVSSATQLGAKQRASTQQLVYSPGVGWHQPPSFQGGGVVPGRIGEPQLIMAHGGEIVSPAGSGAGGGAGIGSISVNVTGNYIASDYDIDEIGEKLVEKIRSRIRI